jgi:hypothetical protein
MFLFNNFLMNKIQYPLIMEISNGSNNLMQINKNKKHTTKS